MPDVDVRWIESQKPTDKQELPSQNRITTPTVSDSFSMNQSPLARALFTLRGLSILIASADNPSQLANLSDYLQQTKAIYRVGLLAGTDVQHDEALATFGQVAASLFDEVIIRFDNDFRNRHPRAVAELIQQGVWAADALKPVTIIPDELAALDYAIQRGRCGYLLVHLTKQHSSVIDFIKAYK